MVTRKVEQAILDLKQASKRVLDAVLEDAASEEYGRGGPTRRGRRAAAAPVETAPHGRKRAAHTAKPRRARAVSKRSPDELVKVDNDLLAFIGRNPGSRTEEIAKGLNVPTKSIAIRLRGLKKAKKLITSGEKRMMTYSVAAPTSKKNGAHKGEKHVTDKKADDLAEA